MLLSLQSTSLSKNPPIPIPTKKCHTLKSDFVHYPDPASFVFTNAEMSPFQPFCPSLQVVFVFEISSKMLQSKCRTTMYRPKGSLKVSHTSQICDISCTSETLQISHFSEDVGKSWRASSRTFYRCVEFDLGNGISETVTPSPPLQLDCGRMLQIIQNKYKHITDQIRKVVFDPFPLNPGSFFPRCIEFFWSALKLIQWKADLNYFLGLKARGQWPGLRSLKTR